MWRHGADRTLNGARIGGSACGAKSALGRIAAMSTAVAGSTASSTRWTDGGRGSGASAEAPPPPPQSNISRVDLDAKAANGILNIVYIIYIYIAYVRMRMCMCHSMCTL